MLHIDHQPKVMANVTLSFVVNLAIYCIGIMITESIHIDT